MSEPERWLSSPDAPGPMRDMLSAAQKVGPSALERAALAGKLGVATSGLWIAPALKGLAGAVLVAGGVWVAATAGAPVNEQAALPTPPPVVQTDPVTSETGPSLEQPPQLEEEGPEVVAPTKTQPERAKKTTRAVPAAPEMKKPSETSLIAGARNSLGTAPEAALSLLLQHAKLYPSGVLAEEREVLRIRALKNLGRAKDAQRQEEKFHEEHPGSVHHVP